MLLANEFVIQRFSVQPRLCVLSEDEEVCQDELTIAWESLDHQDVCLFRSGTKKALECWSKATEGEIKFDLVTDRNVRFELRRLESRRALAKVTFALSRSDKKYRRARRNNRFKRKPWVFF